MLRRSPRLKNLAIVLLTLPLFISSLFVGAQTRFNEDKDLLIANYDCKTDVDDLHSVAAFATILRLPKYKKLNYHAVAGTYGIQDGLYVPPNDLFQLAFDKNWSDAHANRNRAVLEVTKKAVRTLRKKGQVWIAEAGQSDFTATLIVSIQTEIEDMSVFSRIHVVQHSDWNEEVTSSQGLQYVKTTIDYHKIADGNVVGNGTPGFRTETPLDWRSILKNESVLSLWEMAVELGNQYNGKQGRYKNEAIANGGLDFSDTSEIMYILGYADLVDSNDFFDQFGSGR